MLWAINVLCTPFLILFHGIFAQLSYYDLLFRFTPCLKNLPASEAGFFEADRVGTRMGIKWHGR